MLELVYRFCQRRRSATIILILAIEAVTLLFRFGLGLKSTEHTASTVGRLTMGIRIHHGYVGLILLALLLFSRFRQSRNADVMFVVGMSLFLSDVIHHSLLYLITGAADFDLVYPGSFK
ncbi:MAG: hypothetical protein CVV41_03050 [Candidatus Riflebacteria bacterium HGW-Riflebacteria-1]|jgi:hypothetical protein|nr:MAG: hypothetical protein CVV41_03050 [Candidatus Riflebacteria bacterium HGW-Riflebacteria-1]